MKSKTFTKTILILLSLVFILSIGALSTGILDKDILYPNKQEILKDIRTSQEDNYEPNDWYDEAYNLSLWKEKWLSTDSGPGYQHDLDWYEIYIDPGYQRLKVNLTFTHAQGNIDLDVLEVKTSIHSVTKSWSTTDNEYIDYIIDSPGTYYLVVYGDNAGNEYDLWWNNTIGMPPPDDNYEDNDWKDEAYNLSLYEDTWLSDFNGLGIQADYDYYEIYVDPGYEHLLVNVTFTHADGDIELVVYESSGSAIAFSLSGTDNESIDIIVSSPGTYYIEISGWDFANEYDLWWNDTLSGPPPTDDNYEENDDYTTAHDLSLNEGTWLSAIDGLGVQADDDWYEIYVDPGNEFLQVTLTFSHAEGNIDIDVYDASLSNIAGSLSVTDNEYINTIVPTSGIYYLEIYGSGAGNEYDLWWDDILVPSDDNYEENDAYTSAYDFSAHKNVWLSTVNGTGVQIDDDWYEIYIDPGYEQLIVDLTFTHIADNLDLGIYDSTGTLVTESTSSTNNEHIDYVLPSSGTYYIKVDGNDIGNEYDLRWNSIIPDDNYEENDDSDTAYDLSGDEDTLLNTIDGYGVQLDDDWYEISIAEGYENVTIVLTFTHSAGNIELALYNSTGDLITSSASTTDNEYINYVVSSSGAYYIRVYGDDAGNSYNLIWSSIEYTPPGGGGPVVPGYDLLFLFGVIIAISILAIRKLIKRKPIIREKY